MASHDALTFRELLSAGRFAYGAEVVTTRGFAPLESPDPLEGFARGLLDDPRIGWISITDNPGGGPMLPPDWLAGKFPQHRGRMVLHLTCKDLNRNGLEAAAWRYAAEGFENLLAITGDYPTGGFGGLAQPVFDLDAVGLLVLLRSMNEGLKVPGRRGGLETLPKTNFFLGCAVSPFKRLERELMPQYFKLLRKIRAGAQWVIPQLGYDMRKFQEVQLLLQSRGIQVPLIGNVYVLNRTVAKLFHSGKLAGCVVTRTLLERIERFAAGPDKGRAYFRELAAKQLAVFKGLGYAAGYLGGLAKAEQFGEIIDLAESYATSDWRDFFREIQFSQPDEFFLFQQELATGLGIVERINPDYLRSLQKPPQSREVTLGYRISRKVHEFAFQRGRGIYPLLRRLFGRWEKKPGFLSHFSYWLEREAKHLGYACQDCGDCSLPDCAYLCPISGCAKGSRNGPCGGSAAGRCELDDRDCFWTRVYERLKSYGESEEMFAGPAVLYNASLKHTSSWANTFLDRDHHAPAEAEKSEPPATPPRATTPPATNEPKGT